MTEERLEEMRIEYNSHAERPAICARFDRESSYDYEARVIAGLNGLEMRAVYVRTARVPEWEDGMQHDHFIVMFDRVRYMENGRRAVSGSMEIRFHGSAKEAETGLHKTPSMYTVLSCIQKYDPGTLENFCGEFGYDTDSKRADATYLAVKKEYEEFSALFPEGIPEEILDIA